MAWIENENIDNDHCKFGPILFKNESEMEQFMVFNWSCFFGFPFWCRQYRLNKKFRIDLLGHDPEKKIIYVIELKKGAQRSNHITQLNNYMRLLSEKAWVDDLLIKGILINHIEDYLSVRCA